MQARHRRIVGRLLAGLAHDDFDLRPALGHRLLDPARVNAPVGDELGERHAGDFAAHRVEARKDHCLGGVVDDEVYAGRLLEGADVATLAADDSALHLFRRQGDNCHRRLRGVIGRDALHDRGQYPARALVALLGRPPLDLADAMLRLCLGLVDDLLDERFTSLEDGESAHPLERRKLLLTELHDLAPLALQLAETFLGRRLAALERFKLAVETL